MSVSEAENTASIAQLLERCTQPLLVSNAHGLARAINIARAAKDRSGLLVVCGTASDADVCGQDLRFVLGPLCVRELPVEDRSPYTLTSPAVEVVGERLASMLAVASGEHPVVVVTHAAALMHRTLELKYLLEASMVLSKGENVGRDRLASALQYCGYTKVPLVEDQGTYAVRGGLIDVFVPGSPAPVRIDLFGDDVDSIKEFHPSTQRTGRQLDSFLVGPTREVLFAPDAVAVAREALRERADELDFPTRKLGQLLRDIDNAIPFLGIEGLAPAFSGALRPSVLEALDAACGRAFPVALVEPEGVQTALERQWQHLLDGYSDALVRKRLVYDADQHAARPQVVWEQLSQRALLHIDTLGIEDGSQERYTVHSQASSDLSQEIGQLARQTTAQNEGSGLFEPIRRRFSELRRDGIAVVVLVQGAQGKERLRSFFADHDVQFHILDDVPALLEPSCGQSLYRPSIHAWICPVPVLPAQGAILLDEKIAVFIEDDIFGRRARRTSSTVAPYRTSLSDLNEGDIVVHRDFGVGVYRGLARLNVRGIEQDYLLLTYRDDDKLYLPVTRINLVQRYAGGETVQPRLDKLGGQTWARTKHRVKAAILAMAQELLGLYARRELAERPAVEAPDAIYREFEQRFVFEETPDQQRAIDDVTKDLMGPRPMDRLVCGDVGYGKTEVAMRASMLTALAGRQTAVLSPTTVLAQQHYLTFSERFAGLPVRIEVISRLKRTAEVAATLKRVQSGAVDILVGTHRLLSHDVSFKQLGLLVVDEEHRFGVKHKERIKQLRTNVDVLSLSATPIPRTLQMGFFGLRDLSIINTAPVDRRAIRTHVTRFDENVIREAIERELGRGGQVFFVHNRVRSIQALAAFVRRLVPQARVGVAHGQMAETQLEKVMLEFLRGDTNVLVTTTIIESGIDISRANTIIINRADYFGLAQLYQLRGRVGRSHQRAYAYLLVPSATKNMTSMARKRLEVLQRFTELGAGFKIAQHDLELRGAGDLLGKSQHGHVAAVGYEMYAELLSDAVRELKGRPEDLAPEPELNVHVAAFIPDAYVPDVQERLGFYQRMATSLTTHEVHEIVGALEDRYGQAPAEVHMLGEVMALKVKLKGLRARAVDLLTPKSNENAAKVVISLDENATLDAAAVADWVALQPNRINLTPQMKLVLTASPADWLAAHEDIVVLAQRFIDEIELRARAASV